MYPRNCYINSLYFAVRAVANRVPESAVARVLAVDPKTPCKRYRDELDTGQIKARPQRLRRASRVGVGIDPSWYRIGTELLVSA
jgi:hypothetical protein